MLNYLKIQQIIKRCLTFILKILLDICIETVYNIKSYTT